MSPAAVDALIADLRKQAAASKEAAKATVYAESRARYIGAAEATMIAIEMIESARAAEVAS